MLRQNLRVKNAPESERGRDWRDDAACLDEDPKYFDDDHWKYLTVKEKEQVRKICRECPVIVQCLQDAFNNKGGGIRAGMPEAEWRKIPAKKRSTIGQEALIRMIDSKLPTYTSV